jgi:glycosyltransferase involved in cell wall biosynthesis
VVAATRRAQREAGRAFRELRGLPLAHLARHAGVRFDDLAQKDLAAALLLQVPWAVRSYTEMRAAIRWARPEVVALYAESSGWGRAAVLAARAEGVRTVALQHGILYPKYYSYLHRPGEGDAPRPDRTAVFGESARRFLVERGGYVPDSLEVTGSIKFDELLGESASRDLPALRRELGVADGEQLVVVASRFRPIRDTHEAIGPELDRLVRALTALPGVRTMLKPHPAESNAPYLEVLARHPAARARFAPPGLGLGPLLAAADLLVTVESQSAVEALVLGKPVVLLSQPSNLKDLVAEGVALGVAAGADPAPALRLALHDPETGERLRAARERYVRELAGGVDGRAVDRILRLLVPPAAPAAPGGSVVGS